MNDRDELRTLAEAAEMYQRFDESTIEWHRRLPLACPCAGTKVVPSEVVPHLRPCTCACHVPAGPGQTLDDLG